MPNDRPGARKVPPPPGAPPTSEQGGRARTRIAMSPPAPGQAQTPPPQPTPPPQQPVAAPAPVAPAPAPRPAQRAPAKTQFAHGAPPPGAPPSPAAQAPPEPEQTPSGPADRYETIDVPPEQAAAEQFDDTKDFQRSRSGRVGTHIAGTEGLHTPGSEKPQLRLVAGKIVPGTRYRIIRWLGEGGMGVVYEAEHVDIERRVALKILRFDLSQEPRMVQVFRDEARAASRMGSENIVDIYDFGELADGRLFFCMELLEGHDLVPETEDEWTPPEELIATLRQISKGLHAAHLAGIVHRDVKPENIILVQRNERSGMVKIVDFGISSMLAASQVDGGGIAGTPHYMAPEQITGGAFDSRLDVYAVGCVAYELLVGHPPFDADELEELLRQQLREMPLRPTEVRPDRDIPKDLEDVVMRCLQKDPAARYPNMAELEAALCEAQIAAGIHTAWDDLPLPDIEENRREHLLKEMPTPMGTVEPRRRWLWPAVAGGSLAAAVAALAFALAGGKPTAQERDLVEQLTIDARTAGAKANYVYPPPDNRKAPTSYRKVLELEDIKGSGAKLADARGEELRNEFSTTLVGFGDQMWEGGAKRMARDYYVQALAFVPEHRHAFDRSGMTPGALADFLDRASNGDFSEAELVVSRALAAAVSADEAQKRQFEAEFVQGVAQADLSYADEAALRKASRSAGIRGADEVPEAALPPPPPPAPVPTVDPFAEGGTGEGDGDELVVDDENDKSGRKRSSIRGSEAGALLRRAKRDPSKAKGLASQGASALRAGKRREAESLFNQAIAHDNRNAQALMGLSDVYFDTGANQKAVLYAERAVKASPKNRSYRLKLGDAYFKVLRYRDALEQYQEAKKLGSSRADARIAKVKGKVGG